MKQELIEALKKNEKPFGLMSAEMQEAMLSMHLKDIEWFTFTADLRKKWFSMETRTINTDKWEDLVTTYCLRPDYEEEPEIVECEIYKDGNSDDDLTFIHPRSDNDCPIMNAVCDPDFIGFKFEDGNFDATPIRYEEAGYPRIGIEPNKLKSGQVKVLHATHVLFRRSK